MSDLILGLVGGPAAAGTLLADVSLDDITRTLGTLTLQVALGIAVLAFVFDYIRSSKTSSAIDAIVTKRLGEYATERDKREQLIVSERDAAMAQAAKNEQRADEADVRADRLAEGFKTATELLSQPRSVSGT